MTSRPLIGITGLCAPVDWGVWHQLDSVFMPKSYIRAIEAAGGQVVILPTIGQPIDISRLDGLLLSGGEDISPATYGEEPLPEVEQTDCDRDQYELELVRAALGIGLPTVGICRGAQLLNIAAGGTLTQHLPNLEVHRRSPGSFEDSHHPVNIQPRTKLHSIYAMERFVAPAHHHQGIKDLGQGLLATAKTDDGLIEGIETTDGFCIGVQWHPEQNEHDTLFTALINAAHQL